MMIKFSHNIWYEPAQLINKLGPCAYCDCEFERRLFIDGSIYCLNHAHKIHTGQLTEQEVANHWMQSYARNKLLH